MKLHTYTVSSKQSPQNWKIINFEEHQKALFLKEKRHSAPNIFLVAPKSFGKGRNKCGVCLTNALGERLKWANGWASPGFLREEQRSEKLIFKSGNLEKKRKGHSLSGCFPLVLYGVSWLCHIPCISCAWTEYCCHQCHLVTVQLKATCWRTSESWMPALKKTRIWLKPLMSDVIRDLLGHCWKRFWNFPKPWASDDQIYLLFHFGSQWICTCGKAADLFLTSITIR